MEILAGENACYTLLGFIALKIPKFLILKIKA
jgi:hypothetical protein